MRKKWFPLIGSLTVAGTVAFSVSISFVLNPPKEISKLPEQVAQQPANVPIQELETKEVKKAATISNSSRDGGVNTGVNEGIVSRDVKGGVTQDRSSHDERGQQHTHCNIVNNGSACSNPGTIINSGSTTTNFK
jgi:hypothetical protein